MMSVEAVSHVLFQWLEIVNNCICVFLRTFCKDYNFLEYFTHAFQELVEAWSLEETDCHHFFFIFALALVDLFGVDKNFIKVKDEGKAVIFMSWEKLGHLVSTYANVDEFGVIPGLSRGHRSLNEVLSLFWFFFDGAAASD